VHNLNYDDSSRFLLKRNVTFAFWDFQNAPELDSAIGSLALHQVSHFRNSGIPESQEWVESTRLRKGFDFFVAENKFHQVQTEHPPLGCKNLKRSRPSKKCTFSKFKNMLNFQKTRQARKSLVRTLSLVW